VITAKRNPENTTLTPRDGTRSLRIASRLLRGRGFETQIRNPEILLHYIFRYPTMSDNRKKETRRVSLSLIMRSCGLRHCLASPRAGYVRTRVPETPRRNPEIKSRYASLHRRDACFGCFGKISFVLRSRVFCSSHQNKKVENRTVRFIFILHSSKLAEMNVRGGWWVCRLGVKKERHNQDEDDADDAVTHVLHVGKRARRGNGMVFCGTGTRPCVFCVADGSSYRRCMRRMIE